MILVTGACGNTARYVVAKLLEEGLDVVGIDIRNAHTLKIAALLSRLTYKGKFHMVWGNLTKPKDLEAIFKSYELTGIAHLAFIIPPQSEFHPEQAYKVNVGSTRTLIKLTELYAPTIPFVFSSSTTVFGDASPNEIYLTPAHPVKATSNYTANKIECELLLKESSLDWRILRYSVIMNPTFVPNKELIKFGFQIALNTRVEPVHVKDLAVATYHALVKKEASHKIFIIAGGKTNQITYKEYITKVLTGSLGKLNSEDVPWERFIEKPYYLNWYDTTESQEILQFQTRTVDDLVIDMQALIPGWKKFFIARLQKLILTRFLLPK
ncbi:MAG: NAD(P)-dependent oxidoreductase [Gammaproteobacteria bacterium]